jgi:hypothetical protein
VVFAVVFLLVVFFTVVVLTVVVLTVVVLSVVVGLIGRVSIIGIVGRARPLPVQQQAPGSGFWSALQGIRHLTLLHSWKCGCQSTIYPLFLKGTISHSKYIRRQVLEKKFEIM